MNPHSYLIYFNPDGCLTYEGLKFLHSGLPEDEVQQQLAAHVSTCPLCAAAVEGFQVAGEVDFDENYQKLTRHLIKASLAEEKRPKSNALIFKRFSLKVPPAMLKYAAAALTFLAIGTVLLLSNRQLNQFAQRQFASNAAVIDPLEFPDTEEKETPSELLFAEIIMLPPVPPEIIAEDARKTLWNDENEPSPEVRIVTDLMPEFSGLGEDLKAVSKSSTENPLIELANINGDVCLSFIVETDGSLSQLRVLRGLTPAHNKAAAEFLNRQLYWHPGYYKNQACRTLISLSVTYAGNHVKLKKC